MRRQGWAVFAAALVAALVLVWVAWPAHAEETPEPDREPLAASCALSGKLGNPTLRNVGPRNPVKLARGAIISTKKSLYIGSPYRWCPTYVYVHAGYDIRVNCSNGLYYWRTAYGWQKLRPECSWAGGSSTISFNEYKQG